MEYVFCTRNLKNCKFGGEPGPSRFLAIPKNVNTVLPSQKITKTDWVKAVIANAKSGSLAGVDAGDTLSLSDVKRVGVAPRVGRIGLPSTVCHNRR